MQLLDILLIVLAAAVIWAVVELALTLRRTREKVGELSQSATEAIDQVNPLVNKLDGVVDDLQPSVREVPALLERAGHTIDAATTSLTSVNGILEDVTSVTTAAADVTSAAGKVADNAANAAAGVVSKIIGRAPEVAETARLQEGSELEHFSTEDTETRAPKHAHVFKTYDEPLPDQGYVSYGEVVGSPSSDSDE